MSALSCIRSLVLCCFAVSICSVQSVALQDDILPGVEQYRIPVLKPTIHTAVIDMQVKTTAADEDADEPHRLIDKIGFGIAKFFGRFPAVSGNKAGSQGANGNGTQADNGGSGGENKSVLDAMRAADDTEKNGPVERSPLLTVNEDVASAEKKLFAGAADADKRNGGSDSGGDAGKAMTDDIVTNKMRLTSFIEGISASLENMDKALRRFPWLGQKKKPYEIVARNDSMLVVAVPGKRFFSADGENHDVKPIRAVFHRNKLTLEIEELSFNENTLNNTGKVSEKASGIGTEYHFVIQKAYVDVEEIFLRATNGEIPGYEIIVPLKAESNAEGEVESVTRTIAKATAGSRGVADGHWGSEREEDEYEFLQVQLGCQQMHGASGIGKMLCTCEKVHMKSATRRLLCVSRVADKIVRVAKMNSEGRVAAMVYRGSVRCRNARFGMDGSYDCLVRLLQKHAGEKSRLHANHGRNILGSKRDDKGMEKVDEKIGKESMKMGDFLDFDDEGVTGGGGEGEDDGIEKAGLSVLHVLTFTVYVVGIGFMLICLFDVRMQYVRHREGSRADGRVSRLPAQAQALYARLVLRNE